MFRFVIRKMVSKKWMVLALIIGNILLIGITASNPMYTQAVLQRTLNNSLNAYLEANNSYPATITVRGGGASVPNSVILQDAEEQALLPEQLGLPLRETATYYWLPSSNTKSNLERTDRSNTSMILACLCDMPEHIELISGSMFSEQPDEGGVYDVIVSESCLMSSGLIPGEILTFPRITDPEGSPVSLRIAGVFRNSSADDPYWVRTPAGYSNTLFMDENAFRALFFAEDSAHSVNAVWYTLLDFTKLRVEDVQSYLEASSSLSAYYSHLSAHSYLNNIDTLLKNFQKTELKVRTTLWVLQAPIFVLTAAFIFMVARQMLDMEESEISVLKSRGAGKGQIISVYFWQSVFTALVSFLLALPLATLLVQVLGSANAFLEFVGRSALKPVISGQVLAYAGAAALLSIAAMVLPVFRHSKVSIVNQRQKKHRRADTPIWQKFFLDFIVLGVSIYGLYTFNNQKAYLAESVLEGASLDPLLFLSSSLFMLGAGLVALRLLPAIVWLIFILFKRLWSPALYASFLRVLRTRSQQGFIMVFLIMTIALGVFDASAARTINTHDEQNLRYTIGADIVVQEKWENNADAVSMGEADQLEYKEPDYGRYPALEGAESVTKVLMDRAATVSVPKGTLKNVQLMGIQTNEFGRTAWFDPALLPQHWYNYLNAMAQKARAVLVSSNFRDDYGYAIGDAISFRPSSGGSSIYGVIYGFVDYWPGYVSSTYSKGTNGLYSTTKNYLVVANLSQLQATWGVTPYQIWIKAKDSTQFIYDFAEENGIAYSSFRDVSAEIVSLKNDPILQGTNGILTVGFIVVLLLCAVGFLIYWVLSIRSRELQFGIFRAMGMSMREIVTMLINEQFFISVAAILTGAGVGWLTARLYMPLIQIAYSSADNAIPLNIVSQQSDIVRLGIIVGAMILICLFVLGGIIRRMKIAQALKLGED